jgi:hypothetical protein
VSQALTPNVFGLFSSPNQVNAPPGALATADNCVIRSKGLLEPRRGQELLADGGGYLGVSDYLNTIQPWNGSMYAHAGTNKLVVWSGSGWSNVGSTHNAPDATLMRMKFAAACERLYFTTDAGMYRTTGGAAKLAAGVRPFIDWSNSHAVTNANGFLVTGKAVAYVATGREQVGSRWVQGPPSGRAIITNPTPVVVPIGGLVRTGGNLVTATPGAASGFKFGDTPSMTPGEANFPVGAKAITQIGSSNVFKYSEAGANAASTAAQTFSIGAAGCSVKVLLPSTATVNTVIELWRSLVVDAADVPADDVFLCYQGYPSAADIAAGFITITDNTPEVLLGDPGYFTPAVEGILASNDEPPLAKDITLFHDVMVLSNLTEKHQLELRLIATGGSTGIASGDVVTFTRGGSSFGVTWATNQTGGQSVVYNNGSVADDIEKSALAFVDAINSHSSNTFLDAFYVSGADDSPGLVLLRARDFSTVQFTVSASAHINAYTPELSAAKTKAHSTQVQMANGVAWCKPSQPDACPLVNRQPIGDSLEKNLRVVAIRDRVFLVKEHSVWEMTGVYGAWRFDMLDNTVAVVGPDTVVALNNQLFALTSQGPATISTVGVGLLTAPVELDFSTLFANNLANAKVSSWGAAYENEHQYLLGVPTSGSAAVDYVYVWNFMTAAWTRWPMLRKCAAVDPTTTLLWLGDSGTATARRERKTFQFLDYRDETYSTTLTSASGAVLNLLSDANVQVGDVVELSSNNTVRSVVLLKQGDGHHVTVADSLAWGSGVAVTIDRAYACDAKPLPLHMGAPGTDKRLFDVTLHLRDAKFSQALMYFSSEVSTTEKPSAAMSSTAGSGPANAKAAPDSDTNYGSQLSWRFHTKEAYGYWKLQGWTNNFVSGSERSQK